MKTPAAVALGMFDGVHLGHRALMARLIDEAREKDAMPTVFTFSNHPLKVLGGDVSMLCGVGERNRLLRSLGAKQVKSIPFTRELAALSAEQFFDLLTDEWDVRLLVVGSNYTCGARGAGTPDTLREIGMRRGFTVSVVEPVLFEGEPVSSTRIREAIERGDVALAQKLLMRRYTLSGKVVQNKRFGRRIGFPTANIDLKPGRVIPADGVYATYAFLNGESYRAATNIGTNPTVNGKKRTIESHLIDFDADIYGETLTVEFRKQLRGEATFSTIEELKKQIRADVADAAALRD